MSSHEHQDVSTTQALIESVAFGLKEGITRKQLLAKYSGPGDLNGVKRILGKLVKSGEMAEPLVLMPHGLSVFLPERALIMVKLNKELLRQDVEKRKADSSEHPEKSTQFSDVMREALTAIVDDCESWEKNRPPDNGAPDAFEKLFTVKEKNAVRRRVAIVDMELVHSSAEWDAVMTIMFRSLHHCMRFVRDGIQASPYVVNTSTMFIHYSMARSNSGKVAE